jgi:hypothetical protein
MIAHVLEVDRQMGAFGLRSLPNWVTKEEAVQAIADHAVGGLSLDIRPTGFMWPSDKAFPWTAEEYRAAVLGYKVKWRGDFDDFWVIVQFRLTPAPHAHSPLGQIRLMPVRCPFPAANESLPTEAVFRRPIRPPTGCRMSISPPIGQIWLTRVCAPAARATPPVSDHGIPAEGRCGTAKRAGVGWMFAQCSHGMG